MFRCIAVHKPQRKTLSSRTPASTNWSRFAPATSSFSGIVPGLPRGAGGTTNQRSMRYRHAAAKALHEFAADFVAAGSNARADSHGRSAGLVPNSRVSASTAAVVTRRLCHAIRHERRQRHRFRDWPGAMGHNRRNSDRHPSVIADEGITCTRSTCESLLRDTTSRPCT